MTRQPRRRRRMAVYVGSRRARRSRWRDRLLNAGSLAMLAGLVLILADQAGR